MNKAILISFLLLVLTISGCALANKIAPSKLDDSGNPIPGTHDVSLGLHSTASTIPYAEPLIGILLLAWNGVEKYKSYKLGKGLISTVQTIEKLGEDPDMKEAIAKLKDQLSHAHDVAQVQPEIKSILAKI